MSIAKQLVSAIQEGRSFKQDELEVVSRDGNWEVKLHGSKVIWKEGDKYALTLAGWNTVGTRNTINTVLAGAIPNATVSHVITKNVTPYVRYKSGKEVKITPLTEVTFEA